MPNLRSKRTLDYIWNKLADWATGGNGVLANPLTTGLVIDEALTIYVETTGDDTNDGSLARPFRTIQGALDWLRPFVIRNAVTIQVGLGTFSGFTVPYLTVERQGATLGSVTIQGTLVEVYSGTTAVSVSGILDDATKTWTANELKGMYLSYPATTSLIPIQANTATSITFLSGGTPSGVYQVYRCGTTITNTVYAGTSTACVVFEHAAGSSSWLSPTVSIKRVGFACGNYGVYLANSQTANLTECFFDVSPSATYGVYSAGISRVALTRCVVKMTKTASGSIGALATGTGGIESLSGSYIWGTGAAGQVGLSGWNSLYNTGSFLLESLGTGITVAFGGGSRILLCTFVGCTTAIQSACQNLAIYDSKYNIPGFPISSSGNTTFVKATQGAKISIHSGVPSGLATTDIDIDSGTTSTLAAMRALTPKCFPASPTPFGTCVFE